VRAFYDGAWGPRIVKGRPLNLEILCLNIIKSLEKFERECSGNNCFLIIIQKHVCVCFL
jgi:hypothetical protein